MRDNSLHARRPGRLRDRPLNLSVRVGAVLPFGGAEHATRRLQRTSGVDVGPLVAAELAWVDHRVAVEQRRAVGLWVARVKADTLGTEAQIHDPAHGLWRGVLVPGT